MSLIITKFKGFIVQIFYYKLIGLNCNKQKTVAVAGCNKQKTVAVAVLQAILQLELRLHR